MDFISPTQLIVILVIVLLLFGPKNLPRLAQSIGQSVRELKKGLQGVSEDIKPGQPDQQTQAPPSAAPVAGTQPQNPSPYGQAGTSPAEPVDTTKQV